MERHPGTTGSSREPALVPRDVLRDIRARALPGELDKVADRARCLREWFRVRIPTKPARSSPPRIRSNLRPSIR